MFWVWPVIGGLGLQFSLKKNNLGFKNIVKLSCQFLVWYLKHIYGAYCIMMTTKKLSFILEIFF